MDDVLELDGTAQAELIARGQISAPELVEAAIAQIERLNGTVNAVILPLFEAARRTAAAPVPGPFSGVPFLIKDIVADVAGTATTCGSRVFKDRVYAEDSVLVSRYRRAGLIILGKTNTPEFGLPPTTEPTAYGPTRNPWDLGRSAGGSSGGAAAAVAARMVSLAHGNDGGGSIRIPASACGLFGLKPTRGRISLGPRFGDLDGGLVVEHALTRSVRDSARLLDLTHGGAPGDPYAAPAPLRPYVDELSQPPPRLRIAKTTETFSGAKVDPEVTRVVDDAARLLESLGHHVESARPPLDGQSVTQAFLRLWTAGAAHILLEVEQYLGRAVTPEDVEPLTFGLGELGRGVSAAMYLDAVAELQRVGRLLAAFHQTYDVLLTPTLAEPPLPIGACDPTPENPLAGFFRAVDYVPFTPLFNATGQPAMSVPFGRTSAGLPIGVHFAAAFGGEGLLFALAGELEQAQPWAHLRPPLC